jgi:lipid-binding SYLF domain-containing protein
MSSNRVITVVLVAGLAIFLGACATAQGTTPDEKRGSVDVMRREALAELYAKKPEAKAQVEQAAGYAVFSNVGMKVLLLASGNGYGVAHDNETGRDTYMKMRELGVGVGLGVEDFRAVFVFLDAKVMKTFVEEGWEWSGDASATAKSDETGESVGANARTEGGIVVYRFTEAGVALMAAVTGTKYWKDDELNTGS